MKHVFIIAEAGVNHNGNEAIAHKLVDAAAEAGADAVKFQTFRASELVSASAPKALYQRRTTDVTESQLSMIRRLELDETAHRSLMEQCSQRGIRFLSSPFDLHSIDFLHSLGLEAFKIPSGEITNIPYLRRIGSCGVPVILSTGMSVLGEIEKALEVLEHVGTPRERITLLHCTTEYPAPVGEINLRAMETLLQAFPGIAGVGYSDHTQGIHIPVAAVAMGACVIEKHFSLDRNMEGPDHKASLEPDELASMVRAIRDVERARGDGIKRPTDSELSNIRVARKSLVAARPIQKGEVFSEENLTVKRPGTGVSPLLWDDYIGRTALRNYQTDELI